MSAIQIPESLLTTEAKPRYINYKGIPRFDTSRGLKSVEAPLQDKIN